MELLLEHLVESKTMDLKAIRMDIAYRTQLEAVVEMLMLVLTKQVPILIIDQQIILVEQKLDQKILLCFIVLRLKLPIAFR